LHSSRVELAPIYNSEFVLATQRNLAMSDCCSNKDNNELEQSTAFGTRDSLTGENHSPEKTDSYRCHVCS